MAHDGFPYADENAPGNFAYKSPDAAPPSPDVLKLVDLVLDCQKDLARYLPPDSGISARTVVQTLLGRLDGPQAREALGEMETLPLDPAAAS